LLLWARQQRDVDLLLQGKQASGQQQPCCSGMQHLDAGSATLSADVGS